jgi:hypothetical protein
VKHLSSWWVPFAMGYLLFVAAGCTSKDSKTNQEQKTKVPVLANDPAQHYFDGGSYCAQSFMQGSAPPQPLHFSNKITESDQSLKSKDYEAELSGDTLDITNRDRWQATDADLKFFEESRKYDDPKIIVRTIHDRIAEETVTNHFTRSDEVGWRVGATSLVQGGTPWGLFIYKPPVTRVGLENVNGYETTKYTVDTTHQSQPEKSARLLRQLKDYNITGTAWVFKDAGCVLQYEIDDERVDNSGQVSKTHYEGTITKK